MTIMQRIEPAPTDYDPFEEDPVDLFGALEADAGMTVACASRMPALAGDRRIGFGRVYLGGDSVRLRRLFVNNGWRIVRRDQETSRTAGCLYADDPAVASPADRLIARERGAAVFAETANFQFEPANGRFFAKPVEVAPWRLHDRNPRPPGFHPRPGTDLLVFDTHEGRSRTDTINILVEEAFRQVRCWSSFAPAGHVLAAVERGVDLLNHVREMVDPNLEDVVAPGVEAIRKRLPHLEQAWVASGASALTVGTP